MYSSMSGILPVICHSVASAKMGMMIMMEGILMAMINPDFITLFPRNEYLDKAYAAGADMMTTATQGNNRVKQGITEKLRHILGFPGVHIIFRVEPRRKFKDFT